VSRYSPPELLAARHQLDGFRCRSKEQTTRVFVVSEIDQPVVVAYYAWCTPNLSRPEAATST
jgi:hypothetical protein